MNAGEASARAGALGLGAIAGLHCVWATGSSWPLPSRAALSEQIAGRTAQEPPSSAACLAVAALLTAAAALVDGRPRRRPRVAQVGATAVVAVLALRGSLGMAGRTDVLAPGSTSPAFRSRDRRIYSPVCLALAALSLPAVSRSSPPARR